MKRYQIFSLLLLMMAVVNLEFKVLKIENEIKKLGVKK